MDIKELEAVKESLESDKFAIPESLKQAYIALFDLYLLKAKLLDEANTALQDAVLEELSNEDF